MVHLVKDPEGETVMQSGAPDTIQSPTAMFKSSDANKQHNEDEVVKLRQRLSEMELKLAEVHVYSLSLSLSLSHTHTHTHTFVVSCAYVHCASFIVTMLASRPDRQTTSYE